MGKVVITDGRQVFGEMTVRVTCARLFVGRLRLGLALLRLGARVLGAQGVELVKCA